MGRTPDQSDQNIDIQMFKQPIKYKKLQHLDGLFTEFQLVA